MTVQEQIVQVCDSLKLLADQLAHQLSGEPIEVSSPTEHFLSRQAVVIVRQVHSIAILVGFPYYAEQAGQLVRGLTELTRLTLWLGAPADEEGRFERAVVFWKDGVEQTRKKYEYQKSIGSEMRAELWEQLDAEDSLVKASESELGRSIGVLPNAKEMWEDLGREDLYGLFRWESDPSHSSVVTLGTVVSSIVEGSVELGGRNQPRDRARRLGATLMLLQLAGEVILRGLRRDEASWVAACTAIDAEMEELLGPLLSDQVET